jgi:hypothetical protein
MNKKHQASLKAKAKEALSASMSTKGSSKKHSMSGNPGERVPKKERPVKFCQRCKNKGGPHPTHNTNECHKYNMDGNLVTVATLKPSDAKKPFKKGGHKQVAYLMAAIESLVKKGLKKAAKCKKCKPCSYYSSSSNSNSK